MKIAEVRKCYELTTDTLRYYGRIGLIQPVNRDANRTRDYNKIDLRRVDFIKCMCSAGLSIEILIEYVKLVQDGIIALAKSTCKERMLENISVFDFELSPAEKVAVATSNTKTSCFFGHRNPAMVKWLANRKLDA